MEKLKALLNAYKDIVLYVFFGILTTVVNVISYYLCYNVLGITNIVSTIIAWVLAVVFAFITNKKWVFESKSFSTETLKREIPTFFGCRIATGILDIVIMYLSVDILKQNATIWKTVSNIIVIIINYIASKLIIFKK